MAKTNVWSRNGQCGFDTGTHKIDIMTDSFKRKFCELQCNTALDIYVKRIALKAARSVVSVQISSGDKEICGSGFIMECQSIVITSATLLTLLNSQLDDIKVMVGICNGEKCPGEVLAFDFHYNLVAIKVQAHQSLENAQIKHLDGLITIDHTSKPFEMRPHSNLCRLVPGDRVIALGRFHDDDGNIMVSPGEFCVEQCRFDCKELLRSTGLITQCSIGGPIINRNAEVIGINFFAIEFTPFLPINIVSKWWSHYKEFGVHCRPWLGMELSNLFTVELCFWEKIIQKFPNIKSGVLVDEVTPDSPASSAGMHPNEIIVECDGNVVKSSLQFFERTWEKVGKMLQLVVITTDGSRRNVPVMVADITPNQFNRWPVPGHNE